MLVEFHTFHYYFSQIVCVSVCVCVAFVVHVICLHAQLHRNWFSYLSLFAGLKLRFFNNKK